MGRPQLLPRPTETTARTRKPGTLPGTATIAEAVAREMAKAHAHYQAIINEKGSTALPTSLKISSGSHGFKVMDPFDCTKDKSIYQRWQLWSQKARLALDAMEGDSEKTKISYFHHWINGDGITQIEAWKNNKILISQSAYDALESKEGKYSSERIESYFTLFELSLAPRSNPLLAVEGSMTSGEFHSHIVKIVKRCLFPCPEAEERAIRDAIFMGMNSQWARDQAINLMNEEGKELTVDFLMNQLAIEDCNTQHKFLSQLNSSSSVNFAAYDHRQNRRKTHKPKCTSGKNGVQNKPGVQTSSTNSQLSRKPPGMEGKCMRCGKPEYQPGQKSAAKNAKCKDCHKIGHFYKVCQSKKRAKRANLVQAPPYKHHLVVRVDTGADVNCMNEKTFKKLFPKVKLSVCPHEIQNFGNSVADISILGQFRTYLQFRGEKYLNTFIVTNANDCPNSLSQEATFRMGVLLPNYTEENVVKSCGENVPNFKYSTSTGTSTGMSSNVFQILQNLQLKQYQENHPDSLENESRMSHTSTHSTTGTPAQLTTSFRTIARDTTGNTVQTTTSFRTTPTKAMTGRTNTFRTTPNTTTKEQINPSQVFQDTSHNTHLESCMHVHQPMSQVCKLGESLALRKVKHPLNGKTSMSRLPMTKQDILSQYSGCFEGIGHFPGDPYKFHLKPDYKPARHAPRKVPVHLETAFKEEIESLVRQGILEEVKGHTDWVNSYVIVEKDTGNHHSPNHTVKKKLRMCLDPRDLNEALEREPYHTRSVDEITAKLQGMTVFTIVDFKKGYWMVVLHPDSRKLTCMALPFGRFQWTRLPMGTVVAQSKLDAIFIGMEGVTGIADDMIIAGKDEMEHNRNFLAFMEKCMENNLTLNLEKIQFKQSQVSFYGHIWSEHRISADTKKIQALKHMEFPPDKETMRSFLGMINYLNRYSALSAHLAAPLSALTHQATDYKPGKVHLENFQ